MWNILSSTRARESGELSTLIKQGLKESTMEVPYQHFSKQLLRERERERERERVPGIIAIVYAGIEQIICFLDTRVSGY